jgi:general stress protein 26
LLTYSSGQSGDHLVMTGILSIIDDRVKLGALWNSGADQFFPKGPDDPSAILLRFEPNLAEYWKRGSGVISFALQYAKSKLLGGRATPEDHGRVVL